MTYPNVIDFVYSPDDGGWYGQETDLERSRSRVTKKVYSTERGARAAVARSPETIVWEPWN